MAKETLDQYRQKAQLALSQGQYQQSCQFYQQALSLGRDRSDLHYGLATVYFLLNDHTRAIQHFREVIRIDPLRAGAYINLGAIYNRTGQFEEAIAMLRRGIQLDGNRAEGYYNLGLVYRQMGQLDQAVQAYREATRINPRMADAYFNIGNIFLEKQQFAMAIAHYRQAIEIRPRWEKALHALDQIKHLQTGLEAPPEQQEEIETELDTLDPERIIDPNLHGTLMRDLHQVTSELDSHGRKLLEVLQQELEQASRGVANALLHPDRPELQLNEHLQKLDVVVGHVQKLQQGIQKRVKRVQQMSEQITQL